MNSSRLLLPITLLLASALPLAAASDLRVTTIINGQSLELSGVEGRERLLAGPGHEAAPARAVWSLEGDLRAQAAQLRWSPITSISRADERKLEIAPDKPWRAEVHVRHVPIDRVKPSRDLAPLLFDWPEGLPNGGVAVVAWVIDGRASDVVLLPLPSTTTENSFGFAAEFRLTSEQAARGQAVLLLWRDGSFAAPAPLFPSTSANEAFHAVRLDDPAALEKALSSGAKLDTVSRDGLSLAHYAAEAGATRCLASLIQRQSKSASQPDAHEWTPLHHATKQGRTDSVRTLLAAKSAADTKAKTVPPPLAMAVRHGHTEIVTLLLEKRAAASVAGSGFDPLEDAIEHGYADIADLLLAAKMRYDFKAQSAGRDLLLAAVRGHLSIVTWLVTHGVDPNSDMQGTTALAIAAKDGDASSARALLSAGAAVNKPSQEGFTPLMAAAQFGNIEYARVLLDAGADARATSADKTTALHRAALANAPALVELLLERGASIDARTRSDFNALEAALSTGAADAARVLARHGATINLGNPTAESMLAAAVCYDVVEPIQSALREGWPADSTFAGVWPAVRLADSCKSARCLEALLAAGARPPDLSQPMPITSAKELDEPVKVVRNTPLSDPRGTSEVFSETVVRVSLIIDSEGRPLFPKIVESPDARLGQAVTDSLANWRFNPLRRKGESVAVRVLLPVAFPASTNRVFELNRVSQIPEPIKQQAPAFPYALKEAGITGRVELGFVVGTDGAVHDIYVIRATRPEFAAAAIEALSKWTFKPGMVDGRPVNTRMKQPMSFTLSQY